MKFFNTNPIHTFNSQLESTKAIMNKLQELIEDHDDMEDGSLSLSGIRGHLAPSAKRITVDLTSALAGHLNIKLEQVKPITIRTPLGCQTAQMQCDALKKALAKIRAKVTSNPNLTKMTIQIEKLIALSEKLTSDTQETIAALHTLRANTALQLHSLKTYLLRSPMTDEDLLAQLEENLNSIKNYLDTGKFTFAADMCRVFQNKLKRLELDPRLTRSLTTHLKSLQEHIPEIDVNPFLRITPPPSRTVSPAETTADRTEPGEEETATLDSWENLSLGK
jgi:hypothetical protein